VKKQTVEERRTEILETTCEVVIERGFAGTRISDVAKRLDVSSSLIHYHFDSKEQLLAEAFAHYARKDLAEMLAEVESAPSALAKLDRVIHNYVPEGSDDVEWMLWIDGWGEALRNPMMKKISQELDEQSAELLERIIAGGVEAGEFTCADPRAAAMRLTALVDGLAIQFAAHDGMMDRTQLIDHVRTVAAAEVGLGIDAFEGAEAAELDDCLTPPGAATEAALRQLVARYSDGVIRNDAVAWTGTWVPDAQWELKPGEVIAGRDAIAAEWAKSMRGFQWVVQTPGPCVFEVNETGGVGQGRVTVQERHKRKNGRTGTLLATFDDEYRRVNGHWLFARRALHVIEAT
jgi:AcrR family transcriptional regulator